MRFRPFLRLRRQPLHASAIAFALFVAGSLQAPAARADATCISAYEQAQTLRKDGRLVMAKGQAAICARDACPALLTKDCTRWIGEIDAITPSVFFDIRTPAGTERSDVQVKIDGAAVEKLDPKTPLALDPGSHAFVFEASGGPPVERTLVLREGEKRRRIAVTVAAPPAQDVAAGPSRPIPVGFWVFGGASVAALATAAVFAVDGLGKKSDLEGCKPGCSSSDVNAMSTSFTIADVALGAGIVAGLAATYVFLTRPAADERRSASSVVVIPPPGRGVAAQPFVSPLQGGGAFGVRATF